MLGRVNSGWLKQEGWLWSEISPAHVEYEEEVRVKGCNAHVEYEEELRVKGCNAHVEYEVER